MMRQIFGIAAALIGIGHVTACAAQSENPLHVTRASVEPTTGAVTVQGSLDCSAAEFDGRFDVIATLRQHPMDPKEQPEEFPEATGIGSTVTEGCRDGRAREWSMVVQSISSTRFSPGANAHLVVSSLPSDTARVRTVTVSTESDIAL